MNSTLMAQGFQAQKSGDFAQAEHYYHQVIAAAPDHADAHYLLGVTYSQQQRYAAAKAQILKALALKPDEPTFYFNLGKTYEALAEFNEALKAYRATLRLNPGDGRAQLQIGGLLRQGAAPQKAIAHFQQALRLDPLLVQAYQGLGETWQSLNQPQQALPVYQAGLERFPEHGELHRNLALALQSLRQFKPALAHYERALKVLEPSPQIYNNLGNLFLEMGHFKKAASFYQQALNLDPNLLESLYNIGSLWDKQGRWQAALKAYQAYAQKHPGNPRPYCHMGRLLKDHDRPAEALNCYEQALKVNPYFIPAYNEVGMLFLELNRPEKAQLCFEQALRLKPDVPYSEVRLAYALQQQGDIEAAEAHYRKILEIAPDEIMGHIGVAGILKERGQFEEALDLYDAALSDYPEKLDAVSGKAAALEKLGRFQEGYDLLKPYVEQEIYHPLLANFFALNCERLKQYAEAIPYVEKTMEMPLHFHNQRALSFRLGNLYDKLKQPEKAFPYFQRANALKPQDYQPELLEGRVNTLMQVFSPAFMATMPRASLNDQRPVLIVGMPRSGTTLTEQIICSHPEAYGAGELNHIGVIWHEIIKAADSEDPAAIQHFLRETDLNVWAARYLDHLTGLSASARRITDKMPNNFMYLGLIEMLFPDAVLIHCRRHPLDTSLSCFFQDFRHLDFSNNLEHIGHHYLEYQKIMAHWEQVVTLPLLAIDYEGTVADQESRSRQLIAHVGLDWSADCLAFYKTKRHVKTASYDQVRKPIYTSSVARYKPYQKFLEPLIAQLGLDFLDLT